MSTLSAGDPLAAGQEAMDRREWSEALARFEEAAADDGSPKAWEELSRAAWWHGDQETTFAARERAYRGYREAGDLCGAAGMAMWIGSDHLDFHGDDAVALAWLQRGRALLENQPPCLELGLIILVEADVHLLMRGDPVTAERLSRDALKLAEATGEVDIEAVALAMLGSAQIAMGAIDEGLKQLDAGAALAVSEEFGDASAAGWTLCHTVSGCAHAGDFDRAEQWCRALHSWSAAWRARHFFGICRTAYGGVLVARGDWSSADEELSAAIDDVQATRPGLRAPTASRLAELRARQGRVDEARQLFESALPLPDAHVGLGELDLEAGDPAAAADVAERVLRQLDESSSFERLPSLELLARARAAEGDADAAQAALEQISDEGLATPYFRGRVCLVTAEVVAAAGDHEGARRAAEDAIDRFAKCSAPYEGARARLLLARALETLGRADQAAAETRAAEEALALLGTRVDGATEDGSGRGDGSGELSPREVDILRLVAEGLSDSRIAEQLFLSPHTVHRHVANIRTKLRARSRAAAVAEATKLGLL